MDVRQFEIITTNRDYVVKRKGYPKEYHAHFKRRSGALKILELLEFDKMPDKRYFIGSAARLTTEEEFEALTISPKKQEYCNSNNYKHSNVIANK